MTVSASAGCTRIVGPAGSGKTKELLGRIASTGIAPERMIVASPHPNSARGLGGKTLAEYSFDILRANEFVSGLALDLEPIDDVDAEEHFEEAASLLFSLELGELLEPELGDAPSIDYEIAGLRAPERFAQAAYRLIRKLRAYGISPQRFLQTALQKAADWYANPPNFYHPDLRIAAKRYKESLDVDAPELERQRRREIDLAKILAKTYESYVADTEERGCLTGVDAVAEATRVLATTRGAAERVRVQYVAAFVDDAQDLTVGELDFLRAIFGKSLSGVTLAGDEDQATRRFWGARPERVFACGEPHELSPPSGSYGSIVAAAREFLHDRTLVTNPEGLITLFRTASIEREAAFVATEIEKLLDAGAQPGAIAVLARSLGYAQPYAEALLERNIAVSLVGDLDLLRAPAVQDGLSLLWTTEDLYRHDWLLRALQTPTLRFADATLVALCGEPPSAQARLFPPTELEAEDPPNRGTIDRGRDVRLGRNVESGERDGDLPSALSERLVRFRERRLRWKAIADDAPLEDVARLIFTEGGLFESEPGENAARFAYRRELLERFLRRLATYGSSDRTRTLGDALRYFERIATSHWPHCDAESENPSAVTVAQIEAIKGRTYASVFIPNLRAGAFPPYWVPEAFVYTVKWGIIPKDNVGDARASRTAKFTWYQHQAKVLEQHATEARHLLYCAMTRATERLWLSAPGSPTRAFSAPELLAEFEALAYFKR